MSTAAPAGPGKSVAVTTIGLITLLWGGAGAAFGGCLIFAGADWLAHPSGDPMVQVIALGGFVPAMMIVVGVAVLLQGVLGMLAALGALWRKQWGRILTFITAVLAILWGLLFLSGYQYPDPSYTETAVGAAQVLYGILAIVVLITNGAEFSVVSQGHCTPA